MTWEKKVLLTHVLKGDLKANFIIGWLFVR